VLVLAVSAVLAVPVSKQPNGAIAPPSQPVVESESSEESVRSLVESFKERSSGFGAVMATIDSIQARIGGVLTTFRSDLSTARTSCTNDLANFDSQIANERKALGVLDTQVKSTDAQVKELETTIATVTSLITRLVADEAKVNADLSAKKTALAAKRDECTRINSGYTTTKSVVSKIREIVRGSTLIADPACKVLLEKLNQHVSESSMPASVQSMVLALMETSNTKGPAEDNAAILKTIDDLAVLADQEATVFAARCKATVDSLTGEVNTLSGSLTTAGVRIKDANTQKSGFDSQRLTVASTLDTLRKESTARTNNVNSLNANRATKQAACAKQITDLTGLVDTKVKENSTIANLKYRLRCHWAEIDPSVKSNLENATIRYDWREGAWGKCSLTCGAGVMTRTVDCVNYNLQTAADDLCTRFAGKAKPITSQACGSPCPINCQWTSEIIESTACLAPAGQTCGAGTLRQRRRSLPAQHGGLPCNMNEEWITASCAVPCSVNSLVLRSDGSTSLSFLGTNSIELRSRGSEASASAPASVFGLPTSRSFANTRIEFTIEFVSWVNDGVGRHGGIYLGNQPNERGGNFVADWIDRSSDRGYRLYGGSRDTWVSGYRGANIASRWVIEISGTGAATFSLGDVTYRNQISLVDNAFIGFWAWGNNAIRVRDFKVTRTA